MENSSNPGKIEALLANLGKKMDQLVSKAKHASEEHQLNDRLNDLNQTKDRLEKELHEYVTDDKRWNEVSQSLQKAASELKKAFEVSFSTKPKGNPPPPADPAANYEGPEERTIGTP